MNRFTLAMASTAVIVTGDYFMDESMASELAQLGVSVKFKPLWLDDLADLARRMISEGRRTPRVPVS